MLSVLPLNVRSLGRTLQRKLSASVRWSTPQNPHSLAGTHASTWTALGSWFSPQPDASVCSTDLADCPTIYEVWIFIIYMVMLRLNVPVNNFSVMSGRIYYLYTLILQQRLKAFFYIYGSIKIKDNRFSFCYSLNISRIMPCIFSLFFFHFV